MGELTYISGAREKMEKKIKNSLCISNKATENHNCFKQGDIIMQYYLPGFKIARSYLFLHIRILQ